jgi:plastocyanin
MLWLAACSSSPASPSPATPTPLPESPAEEVPPFTISITAENLAFNKSTISVYAGSEVTIEFTNNDSLPHNVAFYENEKVENPIYVGEIITGPAEITYKFRAPLEPGVYFFRCDVHPAMNGDFIVAGTTS